MDRPDDPAATFGARFLEEWKRLGGPLSNWTYSEIQELRSCDREGMAAALKRHHPLTSHAAVVRIRTTESPEVLAREMLLQAQVSAQTGFWMLLALMS
jgi:hypothetical protein